MGRLVFPTIAALLLASCYQEPAEGYSISLDMSEFSRGEVTHVEVYLLEECPDSFVLDASIEIVDQFGVEVDDPSRQTAELAHRGLGTYGVMAIGTTRDCTIHGVACREVAVEDFEVEHVELRLSPQTPVTCDWPAICSAAGVCRVQVGTPEASNGCETTNPPALHVEELDAGDHHTCVRFAANAIGERPLYCWGDNSAGQIVEGSMVAAYPGPELTSTSALDVSAAGEQTCVRHAALGDVVCQGNGVGLSLPGGDEFAAIAAGPSHTCGLIERGADVEIRCWGDNSGGQLLDGPAEPADPTDARVTIIETPTALVTVGGRGATGFTCYSDGESVHCAGRGPGIESRVPLQLGWGGTNILMMVAGERHACLVDDGKLFCWGDNDEGQLGTETFGVRLDLPAQVGTASDWETIAAGGNTTCGIRSGDLYCWGENEFGQAGYGPIPTRLPKLFEGIGGWTRVAVGRSHACGQQLGLLKCWGSADSQQLGGTTVVSGHTPNPQQVCFP